MQKLPLTAVEIRCVLRLTLANMVEPISINRDRKCFYQLKVLKTKRGGFPEKKKQKILSNKKPTNKQNPKTQLKQKGEGSRWSLYGFYSCWIHSNPNSWMRQWTMRMWTLLGKQAGWKLKAEQLFLNYFQHRQAVNFQHQTTCPVHWSSSERSSSSPLLVAFLVVGTAQAPGGAPSVLMNAQMSASLTSPTSTWLTSSQPFLQPHALCLRQANARPENPEQRHREHGRPLQSPDMTTTRVKPGLCILCKT